MSIDGHRDQVRAFGLVCLGLLAVAAVSTASAQESQAAFIDTERVVLENGVVVIVVERPRVPFVAAVWGLRHGSSSESPDRTGAAHLLEHVLLRDSTTLGSRDWAAEEKLLEQLETLRKEPSSRGRALESLRSRLSALQQPGTSARWYAQAGAVDFDALTVEDFVAFHVLVPPEQMELWFWLESDRLLHPALRGLEEELAIVAQERRQRIESVPVGPWLERLQGEVWAEHPYAWGPAGRAVDHDRLDRAALRDFLEAHSHGSDIVVSVVGPVEAMEVIELSKLYFGRVPRDPSGASAEELAPSPVVVPAESPAMLEGECGCRPQFHVRYPAPSIAHPDTPLLELAVRLLNGRSGRLHRQLVLEEGVAFAAYGELISRRAGGVLSIVLEGIEGTTPESLAHRWEVVRTALLKGPIEEAELEGAKNRLLTQELFAIEDSRALALRLLALEASAPNYDLTQWLESVKGATPDDVLKVARRYLNRPLAQMSLRRGGEG